MAGPIDSVAVSEIRTGMGRDGARVAPVTTKPLRIVQAAGWYLPSSTGGTEVYVSELAKRLRSAGHDVRIAAPEALGQDERTYEEGGFPVYRYPIPVRVTRSEAQGRVTVRGADLFHQWLR